MINGTVGFLRAAIPLDRPIAINANIVRILKKSALNRRPDRLSFTLDKRVADHRKCMSTQGEGGREGDAPTSLSF